MSKAWRSVLYAIGALSALCIFISIMIAVVPQDDDRFLSFANTSIKINLNDELKLSDIRIQTNLPQNKIDFISDDENVVKIFENKLMAVGIGSSKLFARVMLGDKVYQSFAFVEVASMPVAQGEDLGVELSYAGSVYDFGQFDQNINLYLPGGSAKDKQDAKVAGYFESCEFDLPLGVELTSSGDCIKIDAGGVVNAMSAGNCVLKINNKNIGKYKTVNVYVSVIAPTDVTLNVAATVNVEVGDVFEILAVSFTPVFASDIFRAPVVDIVDLNIIYLNIDKFVAKNVGQTQITFKYGEILKTVKVVVSPKAYELVADITSDDGTGYMVGVSLLCGGVATNNMSDYPIGIKFIVDGIEYESWEGISCAEDLEYSVDFENYYRLTGDFENITVKFYLVGNPGIFVIVTL